MRHSVLALALVPSLLLVPTLHAPLPALAAEEAPPEAATPTPASAGSPIASPAEGCRLQSASLSIHLAGEAAGMGVTRIEHAAGPGMPEALVSCDPRDALLWRLLLRGLDGKGDGIRIDNRSPSSRSSAIDPAAGTTRLEWRGIDAGDEKGAIDVAVEISLPRDSASSRWRISVASRTRTLGLWEVQFPLLQGVGEKGLVDVAVPRGNWGVLSRGLTTPLEGTYPSNDWPMQMVLVSRGDRGLGFLLEDPRAWPKRFRIEAGGEMAFTIFPEDMGKPGTGLDLPFPAVVHAYRGSWWSGAKAYRRWALTAPWARRGPIAARRDFSPSLRRTALWWLGSGAPQAVAPKLEEAARRLDIPQAVHWYNWHEIPFDVNYPEYFPTKPGFAETSRKLGEGGIVVMPYINGRLWDVGGPNFPKARAAACKQPGGKEVYIETYGSGAKLAPMCPATPLWQGKVREIVRRLFEECSVGAVYIDQIGSAAAVLCHDPSHGHPLGGGSHWVDGYRAMLEPLRSLASERGAFLTTENDAEPYMDTIDAHLIWLPRSDAEVPLTTAVYSGHTVYFSSPSREGMEPDAFVMLQGRDLLWGCQLGWMGFELLDEGKREQLEYLLRCARYRRTLEPYLLEGELLGEMPLATAPPPIEARWGGWTGTQPAKLPSVVTAVWRAADGRVAVLAANLSREPRDLAFEVDPGAWGLPAGKALELRRLRPEGAESAGEADGPFRRSEALGPREIYALEVRPR